MGGLVRDVTAQEAIDQVLRDNEERYRRIAAAEREAREALESADRRKDEFLATLAHELRNPLAPIVNAVTVLQRRGPADAELVWNRDVIRPQTQHMARLLDDLLDVSRITRKTLPLRRQRVALGAVVAAAVETARPLIDAGGHTLTVSLPEASVLIDGDPLRLAQVFANLLNNAAKYTDHGGAHCRSPPASRMAGCWWRCAIPVSASRRPRCRRSSRCSRRRRRRWSAPRAGWASAWRWCAASSTCTAAPSRRTATGPGGAASSVSRCRPPACRLAVTSPPRAAEAAPVLEGLRVVVADDSRDAADTLTMLLDLHGAQVTTAYDGVEAVRVADECRPDVILLDVGMPRMNGYEAAAAIRALPWGRDVLLVAVTGWGQEDDRRRSAEAGFDRHLTKPVDPDALATLLADQRPRRREAV